MAAAVLRVHREDGEFLGTGFAVGFDGTALTCHHVVAGHEATFAIDAAGKRWLARATSLGDDVLVASDIAILQLVQDGGTFPDPVPLSGGVPGSVFDTRVARPSGALVGSVPLSGLLEGPTTVNYEYGYHCYRGVKARVVRGVSIQQGMSGSPAWAPEREAVIGLVAVGMVKDPNIGGLVVPFNGVRGSAMLDALIERNDRTVPRFGIEPNHLAFAQAARRVSQRSLQELADRGIFVADKLVKRSQTEALLRTFLNSPCAALPIIGNAGYGKTSFLAAITDHTADLPILLLRAKSVRDRESPETFLERMLAEALDEANARADGSRRFIRTTGAELGGLLLLDAVNEITAEPEYIVEEWLPDLIALAKRSGLKLVFTCRPELFRWIQHAPYVSSFFRYVRPPVKGKPAAVPKEADWFNLGEYSHEEARTAAQYYGVPPDVARRIGRHPLLLRFAADGAVGQRKPVTRIQVLATYFGRMQSAIRRSDQRIAHNEMIRGLLNRIAVEAAKGQGEAKFNHLALTESELPILSAAANVNLIEETHDGVRFVFDQMQDFVLANLIDALAVAVERGRKDPATGAPVNLDVMALAIEKMQNDGQSDALTQVCNALLSQVSAVPATTWCDWAAAALFGAPRSTILDEIKRRAVTELVAAEETGEIAIENIAKLRSPGWATSLPPDCLCTLLRGMSRRLRGYGWRFKDVRSALHRPGMTQEALFGRYGSLGLINEFIEDLPAAGSHMLLDWLEDRTALAHSDEADLGSFALCMMWVNRRAIGLDFLFKHVVITDARGADALLDALADDELPELADQTERLHDEYCIARFGFLHEVWVKIVKSTAATPLQAAMIARAARHFTKLYGRITDLDRLQVLDWALWNEADVGCSVSAEIRRLAELKLLPADLIYAAYRKKVIGLNEAVRLSTSVDEQLGFNKLMIQDYQDIRAERASSRREWQAVTNFAAREIACKLTLTSYTEFQLALEMMLYRLGFADAEADGLLPAFEAMVRNWPAERFHILLYPVFSTEKNNKDQIMLKQWIFHCVKTFRPPSDYAGTSIAQALRSPDTIHLFGADLLACIVYAGIDLFLFEVTKCFNLRDETVKAFAEYWFEHARSMTAPGTQEEEEGRLRRFLAKLSEQPNNADQAAWAILTKN